MIKRGKAKTKLEPLRKDEGATRQVTQFRIVANVNRIPDAFWPPLPWMLISVTLILHNQVEGLLERLTVLPHWNC